MGIYLSQLPPAEIARLKAELAETLIANFCYPRFFDYRAGSLRMRPVDRAKRQEVWLFLSSMDFSAWNRVDLMSPDFQRQIERLFIHFVQRNRSFFGEQGRKRMADVRMLITTSSQSVSEGLRGHLTSRQLTDHPFGSPRPVSSWTTTNVTGSHELKWDQIVSTTMLLQQQLQEVRGEVKATPAGDAHPAPAAPKRVTRSRLPGNGTAGVEPELRPTTAPLPGPKSTNPLSPPSGPLPASPAMPVFPPVRQPEPVVVPEAAAPAVDRANHGLSSNPKSAPPAPTSDKVADGRVAYISQPQARALEQTQVPATPVVPASETVGDPAHSAHAPRPSQTSIVGVPARQSESTTVLVNDEDVVIFEQLRYQLLTWLRIEAVHAGLEISGQGPAQLLDALSRQDGFEDTRLQVISTLLTISNQVISNKLATILDYKQAMMFYLMHTRRSH